MTFPALKEVEGKVEAKRKELADIFTQAGDDVDLTKVKSIKGTTHDIAAHIRNLNDELTDLGKEADSLRAVQKAADRAKMSTDKVGAESGQDLGPEYTSMPRQKSFGQLFTESDAYKLKAGSVGPESNIDIELKTLLTTSAGWAPEVARSGRLVDFATRPLQVADIIPQTTPTQAA